MLQGGNDGRLASERDLVAAALALGATGVGDLAEAESVLAATAQGREVAATFASRLRDMIRAGEDPLGDAFCRIRNPETRREHGATYTPAPIVSTMVEWAAARRSPRRVVDPGAGSARFLLASGRAFPDARLVGIDVDPLATLMARANLAAAGFGDRSRVVLGDYRQFDEQVDGPTLYVGNPPYVRHHKIPARWKDWLFTEASRLGLTASRLAGLHVHFFLAVATRARPKDYGAFVTAAEWLDVNYGALVRSLVVGELGGQSVTVIEPTAQPFPDAATTAAVTTFEIGARPKSILFRRIDDLAALDGLGKGRRILRDRLVAESRWSHLTRAVPKVPEGYVELGELCRVHRGAVTGANDVWIAGAHAEGLPDSVLFPTVTRAKDVLTAAGVLSDAHLLRRVIDLPPDLDELDDAERAAVERFLKVAKAMEADKGYIARHRKAWWSVGLRAAAPIVSTYMARRAPAFALNRVDARHINVAHGLYPRQPLTEQVKSALVDFLQANVLQAAGRTYAGGLTKFEPREMERIVVPAPDLLAQGIMPPGGGGHGPGTASEAAGTAS